MTMRTHIRTATARASIERTDDSRWGWNISRDLFAVGFPTMEAAIADAQRVLGPTVRIVRHTAERAP